jgi:hypothetical protein
MVVRNDLFGLQSSAATGVCSQTGHDEGRVDWPTWLLEMRNTGRRGTHNFHRSPARSTGVGRR